MAVDTLLFRQVCSTFATGVTVVTTGRDGNYHGMTANAFAVGVSLEPALVLVCLDKSSRTCALLDDTGAFTINILGEDQVEVSRIFASRDLGDSERMAAVEYEPGGHGAPVLKGCLATMQCKVHSRHDAGDHAIFVGEVIDAEITGEGSPLIYFRSAYRRIAD